MGIIVYEHIMPLGDKIRFLFNECKNSKISTLPDEKKPNFTVKNRC